MQKYSGAIDYLVYKIPSEQNKKSKHIIMLLDNHNPKYYCETNTPSKNIDSLFEDFINKDSVFILEELVQPSSSDQIIELFNKTPHIKKYLEFYSKYKSNSEKIIPIDLRLLVDNFHKPDGFYLTDQLFDFVECSNPTIQLIKNILAQAIRLNNIFETHYTHLKKNYIHMKDLVQTNLIKQVCTSASSIDNLDLDYPFVVGHIMNIPICEQQEQILSGLLELYTIAHVLVSTNKYVFAYLGAAHCICIGNILEKYYQVRKIKNLDKFEISGNRFNLGILDTQTQSCVNFIPI